jgi:hypothetical protein
MPPWSAANLQRRQNAQMTHGDLPCARALLRMR